MGFLMNLLFGKSASSQNERGDEPPRQPAEYPLANDIVCERWKVKGKYPGTGRMRTVQVTAWNKAPEIEIVKKAGLTEPYEIEKIGFDPPTEKQVAYSKDLGIQIPVDATKDDLSILISRAVEHKPIRQQKAPTEILEILVKRLDIYIPTYAGEAEMSSYYMWQALKNDVDKYAFFAMKVYAQNTGKNYHVLQDANEAERERFYQFARKYKDDRSFIESYERYQPEEITLTGKIKRKLKAYELANAFFYENL